SVGRAEYARVDLAQVSGVPVDRRRLRAGLRFTAEGDCMTTRILGPRGGRRRRLLLLPTLVATALALLYVTGAQAVHDVGVFQLDRNAQTSVPSGAAGEDWDRVCPASTPPGAASCLGGTTA